MVAALVLPVSGPYTATYGGSGNNFSLGTQNDDGFILAGTYQGQEVNASDAYGMTLVEAIFRGINWRLRFRSLEFNKPGVLIAIQVFGSSGAAGTTFTPSLGSGTAIGGRYSQFAQALVLSSILGSPPTFVQSLTAMSAIVAPQSNVEYLMTSKVREAPFEFILLPYAAVVGSSVGNAISFSTT